METSKELLRSQSFFGRLRALKIPSASTLGSLSSLIRNKDLFRAVPTNQNQESRLWQNKLDCQVAEVGKNCMFIYALVRPYFTPICCCIVPLTLLLDPHPSIPSLSHSLGHAVTCERMPPCFIILATGDNIFLIKNLPVYNSHVLKGKQPGNIVSLYFPSTVLRRMILFLLF